MHIVYSLAHIFAVTQLGQIIVGPIVEENTSQKLGLLWLRFTGQMVNFYRGVGDKHSKDESLFVRETYRREPSSSSIFSCHVPWKTAPGVVGVSWCLSPMWQFEVLTWCGLSLTGASGLVLAVVEGERQICHIFVVCAAMLMEHSKRSCVFSLFLASSIKSSIKRTLSWVFWSSSRSRGHFWQSISICLYFLRSRDSWHVVD